MADAKMLKKVPVREQDPKVRATNFEEVCLGYNQEEAMEEAQRCLGCKKPKCVEGCPVSINIPGFIEEIIHNGGVVASLMSRKVFEQSVFSAVSKDVIDIQTLLHLY